MSSPIGGSISVIIPTLNEAENIETVIARLLENTENFQMEIIVVDDASTDGTQDKVRALAVTKPVQLLERKNPTGGLAGAVLAGAAAASHEVVVVIDADLSHPPERVPDLVRPVLAGEREMVIGSRYMPGGSTPGWSRQRRLMSRAASAAAWPLTDVHDSLSGFFAVRRALLRQIPADAAGFKIALEVLVRGGESLRVSEIPIAFRDRTRGASKMGPRTILIYFRRLLALSGWRESAEGPAAALSKTLAVLLVDFGLFLAGLALGLGLSAAQITAFAVASLFNLVFKIKQRPEPHVAAQFFWRFGLVAVMAFFLRGGVLALFAQTFSWPPACAILPAILTSAFVGFLGYALFIWPVREQYGRGVRWRVAALGITAFFVALRLVYFSSTELLPEEAYYWNYAQHPALGYLDHPPMVAWLIGAGTALLGHNAAGVRLGALLCWLIATFFLFKLARNFFDKSTAFRAMMLLAVLPAFFGVGSVMTPDAPLVACWAGALYFFERVFFAGSARAWLGAGACLGLGMDSKYSIGLVGLAAIAFTLFDKNSRRWLLHPAPYLAALLSVALFSPVIIWNAQNEWASFVFQGPRRWQAAKRFSVHELFLSMLILLTPTGLAAAFCILISRGEKGETGRRSLFVKTFTLLPLAVFTYYSIRHRVEFNWTTPLWLAVLPPIAAALDRHWLRAWWAPTFALLILSYGFALYHLTLGWPRLSYPRHMELFPVGWSNLAQQVSAVEKQVQAETGALPLTVGMDRYQILAELTFYDPDQAQAVAKSAGAHLFGQRSLMFERWLPRKAAAGKNAVLVGLELGEVKGQSVSRRFERVTDPVEGTITQQGKFVRHFYYRIGYGYRARDKEK